MLGDGVIGDVTTSGKIFIVTRRHILFGRISNLSLTLQCLRGRKIAKTREEEALHLLSRVKCLPRKVEGDRVIEEDPGLDLALLKIPKGKWGTKIDLEPVKGMKAGTVAIGEVFLQ